VGRVRAVTIPTPGGPEALVVAEVDEPVAGAGEVLVDVVATAVNRADVLQRRGFYDPPPGASPYPGLECAGRIAALGAGVAGWQVGDEVCALLSGGGYAERVAVPAGQLLPVPASMSLLEAAAVPEVVCTVWSNVFQLAALQPGEVLLVHGGTSGSARWRCSSRPGTARGSCARSGRRRRPPGRGSSVPSAPSSTGTRTSSTSSAR
jgi:NADPH:quinone reductase-like Zn-dependent oxidoreductase